VTNNQLEQDKQRAREVLQSVLQRRLVRGDLCSIDAITAALQAERERTRAEGWQLIETAPKDGTDVLIAFAGGRVQMWQTRRPDEKYFWYENAPTHWMPLPDPPVEQPRQK
jgi:hypothetical protein